MESAMTWATVAAAVGAMSSAAITWLLYRTSTDPYVIVYTSLSPRVQTVILVVIENIGRGVAKDVTFSFQGQLPWKAWGIEKAERPAAMDRGPLVTGIPYLAPGQRREFIWGQFGGLSEALGERCVRVTTSYAGDGSNQLAPERFITESLLEVRSFEFNIDGADNSPKEATKQLARIADAVSQSGSGYRPLHIVTHDSRATS